MLKKNLGKTDEKVSVICLGSMTWGQQNSESEAHRQMDLAVDAGVNFIDTAEVYAVPPSEKTQGLSEAYIGSWLKKRKDQSKLFIASKVAGRAHFFPYLRPHLHGGETRLDKASLFEAVEGSLKRLNLETIDLYQLHWPERHTNNFYETFFNPHPQDNQPLAIEETLTALGELVEQGKIRYIGLSNETPWGVSKFLEAAKKYQLPEIVSIQNAYSLVARGYDLHLAEFSIREKVGLLAYSPLAGGALSGKYLDGVPKNSRWDLFPNLTFRYGGSNAIELMRRYTALAKDIGITPANLALAWCIQRPHVTSAIIGATTEKQLLENLDAVNHQLSEENLASIDQIFNDLPIVVA